MPRRYEGTVGGQPATAELAVARGTVGGGIFYLWRGGPAYELHGTKVLTPLHGRIVGMADQYLAGSWHLARPAGRVLVGYWQDTAGRQRPFVLRESYAHAVRYELQALTLWGGPSGSDYTCLVPHYKRDYLQLLGAVSQALRRQQAPPLARRRRQMRASFPAAEDCEYEVTVRLNDFNLLSYQTVYSSSPFGGRQQYGQTGTLIDLVSGRTLTLASQLRPHYKLALRHLLAQHLLHDAEYTYLNKSGTETWYWADTTRTAADTAANRSLWTWRPYAPFSARDALFTGEGLEVNYWQGSLLSSSVGNADLSALIPYAELRPLVRPGTPLARMLQARGLW
jgi:hypothetical protein